MHVLFHRTTPWKAPIRGSTNIFAQLFAEDGYAVTYMEGTAHLGHVVKRNRYGRSWKQGPRREDDAWVFTPLTPIPFMGTGTFATPEAADRSYRSASGAIRKAVEQGGQGSPDVLWVARPGASALKAIFPDALLAVQVVDYYPAFGGAHMQALERQDYARADVLFSIGHALTRYLTDELSVPASKIVTLGQGVFNERFEVAGAEPSDLDGLPHPRAVWVGWTDKVDAALFEETARVIGEQGGSVVLIGGITDWARAYADRHPHVRLLGPRPPEETPALLVRCDIGLMLYDQNRQAIYRGQHPLKLYEYAAAGLGIVSTPHDEFATLQPPVVTVERADQIGAALQPLLAPTSDRREAQRAFARSHDWQRVYERARDALMSVGRRVRAEVRL
ncbi:MAG: hypothetical protein AAFR95_14835 [Bacteroidota bacterium]